MPKPDYAHRLTDKELAALEKRIASIYKQAADDMKKKVDSYFESFAKRDAAEKAKVDAGAITEQQYKQWRLAQIGRGERMDALRNQLAARMTKANEVAASYINNFTPGIYSLNRNYAAYTIEQVSEDVGFTLFDEQTVKRLIKDNPDLMPNYPHRRALDRGIDLAWGKRQITAQVTSGILKGESIKNLSDRLQKRIPQMNRDSAIRAARTAVTGAQNAGRIDSYNFAKGIGIDVKKEWIATLDGRTRDSHAKLDGIAIDNEKEFDNGCMFPGDPNGPPEEIYNCRCTLIASIPDVDTRGAKRSAIDPVTGRSVLIDDMTYQEWIGWKEKRQRSVENSDILRYNETIQSIVKIDAKSVYDAAKNGERHGGVYKDALKKKKTTLKKSIASHTSQVEEHNAKKNNPSVYDSEWDKKSSRARDGLLRKWRKDMHRNAEQAIIEIEVWKERFGFND